MELTEFVTARLDEDQVAAEEALERGFGGWEHFADLGVNFEARTHIAHHHPARVLAQVAAMRAIVEFHESWPVLVETPPEMSTATDDAGNMTLQMAKQVAWLTNQEYRKRFGDEPSTAPMLRHLAAIWADHEAYDPAWAPDA